MFLLVGQLFAQNSGVPGELIGEWRKGGVSMMSDVNTTTGARTPSNGSTFSYSFSADGRFEFVGLMQSTMYGCTTGLFNHKAGKVEVEGSTITFIPSKNYWKNTYSCSPSSNKERDYLLDRETYEWRTTTDEYGKQFICLADSKGENCYRREEK
jgi:hypothetical protein